MTIATEITEPVKLTLDGVAGTMAGNNGRYEKFLKDLDGLYQDAEAYHALLDADKGAPVYWVESSQTEEGPGGQIIGISVMEPGVVGDEYVMTRGHLHVKSDRAELYHCLNGRGVMLLDSLDGRSKAIELNPGEAVYVPGHWVHRSVNVGTERLATLFCYPADSGQDYGIIERAGGMKNLIVADDDGWATRPNPNHRGYGA